MLGTCVYKCKMLGVWVCLWCINNGMNCFVESITAEVVDVFVGATTE